MAFGGVGSRPLPRTFVRERLLDLLEHHGRLYAVTATEALAATARGGYGVEAVALCRLGVDDVL